VKEVTQGTFFDLFRRLDFKNPDN